MQSRTAEKLSRLQIGDKAIVKNLIITPSDYRLLEDGRQSNKLTEQSAEFHRYWPGRAVEVVALKAQNSVAVNMGYACVVKSIVGGRTGVFFLGRVTPIKSN